MEGVSSSMTSALASLTATETGAETQVKVLKMAMEQAENNVAPLLENLGRAVDTKA